MPVRETDKRRQELQQLEARRDLLVKALRDQDWIERLTSNDDFKRYLARVSEAQAKNLEHQAEVVQALGTVLPQRKEQNGRIVVLTREELNEQLIVISSVIDATADVTGWPAAQESRLEEARKTLPDLEKKIKELGE